MAEEDDEAVSVELDVVNEMIVVAAALVDDDICDEYVPKIPTDEFQDEDNALIWDALKAIKRRGKVVDTQALHKELSGSVNLDYIQRLVTTYPEPPADMEPHIAAIKWDAVRAEATRSTIPEFLRAFKDPQESATAVQALAKRVSQQLDVTLDRSFMSNPKVLAAQQKKVIADRANIACYEYGIPALDYFEDGTHRMIPGAAPGKITLVTGVSGSGKSVLSAYIALQQALRGRRVLYGAWEMGSGETLEMLTNMSFAMRDPQDGISGSRYATSVGALNPEQLDSFADRMEKIAEWVRFFDPPFHNDPSRKYTNEDSLSEIYRMVVDSGCEVVVYDLWERCIPDGSPGPERRALFTTQSIHKQTHTHGLIVCQQKLKEVESRPDKRPTRNTILGSSAFVDIGDTIIGVHRPALWKPIQDDSIETPVLKQRFGKWPMNIQHDWDGDQMTITDGREIDYDHPGDTKGALF